MNFITFTWKDEEYTAPYNSRAADLFVLTTGQIVRVLEWNASYPPQPTSLEQIPYTVIDQEKTPQIALALNAMVARPSKGLYPRNDPHWVVADNVEAATPDKLYVNVTYGGQTYTRQRVTWHNPVLDKSKSDILVQDSVGNWLYIEFRNDDIKPYQAGG